MTLRGLGRRRVMHAFFILAMLALAGGALLGATSAAADTTFSEATPTTYVGANPCTGEPFTGTGMMHFLESTNLSASGALNYDLDVRFDGVQAVTPTGKKYIAQDVYRHHFVFTSASEDTFDITVHYVRTGEDGTLILGDDFYEYLRTHITANANGMVTAYNVSTNDGACQ